MKQGVLSHISSLKQREYKHMKHGVIERIQTHRIQTNIITNHIIHHHKYINETKALFFVNGNDDYTQMKNQQSKFGRMCTCNVLHLVQLVTLLLPKGTER